MPRNVCVCLSSSQKRECQLNTFQTGSVFIIEPACARGSKEGARARRRARAAGGEPANAWRARGHGGGHGQTHPRPQNSRRAAAADADADAGAGSTRATSSNCYPPNYSRLQALQRR